MIRSVRAPASTHRTLAAALCLALSGAQLAGQDAPDNSASAEQAAASAQVAGGQPGPCSQPPSGQPSTQLLKLFDFDERPLGNFEQTPMYWQPMTGEGFLPFSTACLDDQTGHRAAPSFLFTLRGGNIGYEYVGDDLLISPDCDYLLEAYLRAEGLRHARAFLACYLVDQEGQRIAGSERISRVIGADTSGLPEADQWQRVEISLRVDDPRACRLRLQLWLLQSYVFSEPGPDEVDPIIRQDVSARVWFDDLAIIRVPRLRLWLSRPGGLILAGEEPTLHVEVRNATLGTVRADLSIRDQSGQKRFRTDFQVPPRATDQYQVPVPSLPTGSYKAEASLTSAAVRESLVGARTLARRAVRFAVLPEFSGSSTRDPRLGLDLGPWPASDLDGAAELVLNLPCAAVKVGLPTTATGESAESAAYLAQVRELVRRLSIDHIETVGVILPDEVGGPHGTGQPADPLAAVPHWDAYIGPWLAHLAGHITSWQLGADVDAASRWPCRTVEQLDQVAARFERFVALPRLIVPCSILDAPWAPQLLQVDNRIALAGDEARGESVETCVESPASRSCVFCYRIPADLPARAFPWQLAFWADDLMGAPQASSAGGSRSGWLSLQLGSRGPLSPDNRLSDSARRLVLARAVNPQRLFLPAPMELSDSGGDPAWQPTEDYIPLHTLLWHLAGLRPAACLKLPHEAEGILFSDGSRHTLVTWTWLDEPQGRSVELYLGPNPTAVELSGQTRRLEISGLRARVPLTAAPLIIKDVDGPLALLQDGFRIGPRFLQPHDGVPQPVLTVNNPYPSELVGTITLEPPPGWAVQPDQIPLCLEPGQTLSQKLTFSLPPRQVACQTVVGVRLGLVFPQPLELRLDTQFEVGLEGISLEAAARWEGEDLIVEQSLRNSSPDQVSFDAFCQVAERPRIEGLFLNVLPQEVRVNTYVLPQARELAGSQAWLGIQEIGGRRALDQLVVIPP